MCLDLGYRLCGIRLTMEDPRSGDRAVLRPCRGCGCWTRVLWCQGQVLFGFLPPGDYVLTLCRGRRRMVLLVRLPPGDNAEIRCGLEDGRCRWRRDGWHYFFNARR